MQECMCAWLQGLGWLDLKKADLDAAYVLHWTGPDKPWLPKGRYKQLWEPYTLRDSPVDLTKGAGSQAVATARRPEL